MICLLQSFEECQSEEGQEIMSKREILKSMHFICFSEDQFSLFERQSYGGEEREIERGKNLERLSLHTFIPKWLQPGQSQEPGIESRFPTCFAGVQALEPTFLLSLVP